MSCTGEISTAIVMGIILSVGKDIVESTKMTDEMSLFTVESQYLTDAKKLIRERIIPWEGLSRADVISEDEANNIKILEKQSLENKFSTILSQLSLYSNTLLNVLNKLKVNSKDDVLKNVLNLINDLLLELPKGEFMDALLELNSIDESLPYYPFLKHLENKDVLIKILSLYNLTLILNKQGKSNDKNKVDKEILIKVFDTLLSEDLISSQDDANLQLIGTQLLLKLLVSKQYKSIYCEHNLISNFRPLNQIVTRLSNRPNGTGLQLLYYTLLSAWILSFDPKSNYNIIHNFPEIVGSLLILAKDSIKLKIIRVSIAILKNYVTISPSSHENYKATKIVLFHDGLNIIKLLENRKLVSNGSDEELSSDLESISNTLNEVVQKLTSWDEYLTELDNPNLISWTSPTHKSSSFWQENSNKFTEGNFKFLKKLLLDLSSTGDSLASVILLNDLQYLIKNTDDKVIEFVNRENDGKYKLLVMGFLESNSGNNELKFEALKTVQLLLGHKF